MKDVNEDGLQPGQDVDFETLMRLSRQQKPEKPEPKPEPKRKKTQLPGT
jgi:hypothetical protein